MYIPSLRYVHSFTPRLEPLIESATRKRTAAGGFACKTQPGGGSEGREGGRYKPGHPAPSPTPNSAFFLEESSVPHRPPRKIRQNVHQNCGGVGKQSLGLLVDFEDGLHFPIIASS